MKKKLLENDIFYLSLFVCVCLVAIGGVWFTNNNVNKLASNDNVVEDNKEIHLIDNDKEEDAIPTTTDSNQNLSKAKESQEGANSKLSFLGKEVIREYSETEPSYSETLNVWEIHKGIDVSVEKEQEIKSLMNGKVVDIYKDDQYGMSVKVQSEDNITVVYSNLSENVSVEKNQEIVEGDIIGVSGNTTIVECKSDQHVHIEAYKGENSIDPMTLIN